MSDDSFPKTAAEKGRLDRHGAKRIAEVVIWTALTAVILFVSAGRLDWLGAWVYLGITAAAFLVVFPLALALKPEVVNARGRSRRDARPFDKVLMAFIIPLYVALPLVAGLDAGRFGWAPLPRPCLYVGAALYVLGLAVTEWALFANAYFETTVRVQRDRGHRVVSSGPYRAVRHPGYAGMILIWAGTTMILGSAWALVPAGLLAALIIARTWFEDRTLRRELAGYEEYATSTRYRLVPLLW
jgi:protein-S-isoprenylcysteine O-methyltransferase Ste14